MAKGDAAAAPRADPIAEQIAERARRARAAADELGAQTRAIKDRWLLRVAERLAAATETIAAANRRDLDRAAARGLSGAPLQRLELAGERWSTLLGGLAEIAALPDPVGEITRIWQRPNGLQVGRMRIPLGVIGIIYESRPNVTVDAAALCIKAGNAVILRGGSEALDTNLALAAELRGAARDVGLPEDAVCVVATADRSAVHALLQQDRHIDLIIPRGGPGLIRTVVEQSRIPVICHDAGVCHIFLDASADEAMATAIVLDSKLRQMAVCNGLETLLVHRDAAPRLLKTVLNALGEAGVEIRACSATRALAPQALPATESDWSEEYLGPVLAVRVVSDLDAAVEHIRRYGSNHTEVIVTADYSNARAFVRRVASSTVGVNCSTAFADGKRLGLGAEIGISTSKLHAYGPMGLEELTAQKFVLFGEGQLRG